MPTVKFPRSLLFSMIGVEFTDKQFDEMCFQFGIELDEVVVEKALRRRDDAHADDAIEEDETMYKIEVPANRADLLSIEGLTLALKVFLEKGNIPDFKVLKVENPLQIVVKPDTARVRPYVVCAVLRGCKFTPESYNSFIEFQDKLHQNVCRKRTLVAIGTHDLDTISPPFSYEALPPRDLHFVPLNVEKDMNGNEIIEHYEADSNMKPYALIIKDNPVYPIIYDSNRVVLSLPPLINGHHSRLTSTTKNVFIECTATDLARAETVVNTLTCAFSSYCEKPFTVEGVEVKYEDGRLEEKLYPDLSTQKFSVSCDQIRQGIGVDNPSELTEEKILTYLKRMMLQGEPENELDGGNLCVRVPAVRADILHPCDIIEDVAIAYGYNNVKIKFSGSNTTGRPYPINNLTELVRDEMGMAGYTEVLTLSLCSLEENFTFMNLGDAARDSAVKIANPKTAEFQVVRTMLLPGIFKTLSANRAHSMPVQVFEVSDVVVKDGGRETGARNQRNVCAVYIGTVTGFEIIHGLVDHMMRLLLGDNADQRYSIREGDAPYLFPSRRAEIVLDEHTVIGTFGVVHPQVLKAFDLSYPASAMEFNLEPFL